MPGPNEEPTAPYIPFRTFLNLIIKMEEGVPQRLDKSFLTGQAGGLHQPIIAAFRFFGFVDAQGLTQRSLHDVATNPEQRDEFLAAEFRRVYLWAVELGDNSTQAQLDEAFKENTGLAGSSLRKAVTFYLHGARHLGIPVSKHFSTPRSPGGGTPSGKTRRKPVAKRSAAQGHAGSSVGARTKLHAIPSALVEALVKQLEADGTKFDLIAFDNWVNAFKGAVPVWAEES